MKKVIALFLLVLLVLAALAGCAAKKEAEPQAPEVSASNVQSELPPQDNEKTIAAYDKIVKEYATALSLTVDEFDEKYFDSSINTLMVRYAIMDNTKINYATYDINGDGILELLFSNGRVIIDIYSLNGENAVQLFPDNYFGERTLIFVLSDGNLLIDGANSAASRAYTLYKLSGYSLTETESDGYDYTEAPPAEDDKTVEEYYEYINKKLENDIFDKIEWKPVA